MKTPEQMTPEEFARSLGVDVVEKGFSSDVSPMQLARMTSQQLAGRKAQRAGKQKAYNAAEQLWEDSVWDRYILGEFGASEVFDTEAFYFICDKADSIGVEMMSPFRLSQLSEDDRDEYLQTIDRRTKKHTLTRRNFYPNVLIIANDLHKRGIVDAGELMIDVDW